MRTKARTFLKAGIAAWLLFCGSQLSIQGATLLTGFTEAAWGASIGNNSTAMAFAPDGRLFVCQQNGHLRVIDAGGTLLGPDFVTLTVDSLGERGLLGIAFDPSFSSNRFVYVYYTVPGSPPHNRVSRFTASSGNPNVVQAGSEVQLLNLENLSTAQNHNGGAIHFGPDGKLYVAVGENALMSNSQNLTNRLGKILRINSDGSIPTDNPTTFPLVSGTGSTTGVNRAIWAIGVRNPFTFAFQPGTTRMFINDVGGNPPGANGNGPQEEINDGIAGKNYGWPDEEGPTSPPNANYTDPLFFYGHGSTSTTGCAITGGTFYNPAVLQFPASYVGKYFFADYCTGWIRVMDLSNNTASGFASGISNPVDLHVGPDGALYYLTQGGQVTRVQATPSQALNISTRARIETGDNVLIGGFIITGSGAKNVIIRGLGLSLPANVPNRMADPVLELHAPSGAFITSNDDWRVPAQNETAVQATTLAPGNDSEPAIVASLQPGTYTAIMSGKSNSSGSGLIEVYDLNPGASSQLANISSRGFVQTGDNVMIGGFIIGNNIGATKVVVRVRGPSLPSQISNPLADPTLELHDGNGALVRFNNDWHDDATQAAQITATGLQPSNNLEPAIFAGLAPDVYTAIVRGNGGGTGIGLIEVYMVP
jgi:glucose/arabinose dehydrogenase